VADLMSRQTGAARDLDPFDLPEWLGAEPVIWTPESGIHDRHLVTGALSPVDPADRSLPCALLAVDEAYPEPVADDDLRHMAHQAWKYGEVLLVTLDDRMTLAVPGTSFTADLVLDALARFAKAVGARPEAFSVLLRLGG
jgi:hypothetical protein